MHRTGGFHIFFVPEAPEYTETGNTGVVRRDHIHLAVTHINAAFSTNSGHGGIYHVRCRLPRTVGSFTQGVYALFHIPDSAIFLRSLLYVVVMCVLFVLTFVLQQRWVFAGQKAKNED